MLKFAEPVGSNYLLRLKCEPGKGYKIMVITVQGSSFYEESFSLHKIIRETERERDCTKRDRAERFGQIREVKTQTKTEESLKRIIRHFEINTLMEAELPYMIA